MVDIFYTQDYFNIKSYDIYMEVKHHFLIIDVNILNL